MFTGVIIKESLEDRDVLDGLMVTKTETEHIKNPAPGQPGVWHLHYFEISDAEAEGWATRFAAALKDGKWYIDFKSDTEVFVVFPKKVFHYKRGDKGGREEAQTHGSTIGIPDAQLDWGE